MKTRFLNFWEKLRSSYWFVPALMAISAVVLSFAMIAVDENVDHELDEILGWIYTGGPEGARQVLSTIAGSMITVAGVTFSITIVAISLAAAQYGSRLLNNFMQDTANQVVLGTFISTFLYCLLVLRAIRGENGSEQIVPQLSVTVGLFLAVASLGVLIFFISHVTRTLQAETVIANIGKELDAAIERSFPDESQEGKAIETELREEADVPANFDERKAVVQAKRNGHLQVIDYDSLMKKASEHDLILRIDYRPGDFVAKGNKFVWVYPQEKAEERLIDEIRGNFVLGTQYAKVQDLEFNITQLVEIAVRSLSQGAYDPYTAMDVVDQLGASLSDLAKRNMHSAYRYDEEGNLRLITKTYTFPGVLDTAFNQIRQHSRANAAVTIRLLEAIAIIILNTRSSEARQALFYHASLIKRGAVEDLPEREDRKDVERRYEIILKALEEKEELQKEAER
jgi:uncharacterized membrane protein